MDSATPPTPGQLLNLVDRAEHKGGLTPAEAARLRHGLHVLTHPYDTDTLLIGSSDPLLGDNSDLAELRLKYNNERKTAWRWRTRAQNAIRSSTTTTVAPADEEAHAALHRVTAIVQRWTHIPAKRAAAAVILDAIQNRDRSA